MSFKSPKLESPQPPIRQDVVQQLLNVDQVPQNVPKPNTKSKLYIFEDNDAVIKMTVKGRAPTLRHVPRTHRVDLDWLFERIRDDPGIHIRYVSTKEQIADIFTKGSFTVKQWNALLDLAQIGKSYRK